MQLVKFKISIYKHKNIIFIYVKMSFIQISLLCIIELIFKYLYKYFICDKLCYYFLVHLHYCIVK